MEGINHEITGASPHLPDSASGTEAVQDVADRHGRAGQPHGAGRWERRSVRAVTAAFSLLVQALGPWTRNTVQLRVCRDPITRPPS